MFQTTRIFKSQVGHLELCKAFPDSQPPYPSVRSHNRNILLRITASIRIRR